MTHKESASSASANGIRLSWWRRRRAGAIALLVMLLLAQACNGSRWMYLGNSNRWLKLGGNLGDLELSLGRARLPHESGDSLWYVGHWYLGSFGTQMWSHLVRSKVADSYVYTAHVSRIITLSILGVLAAGWIIGMIQERRANRLRGFDVIV